MKEEGGKEVKAESGRINFRKKLVMKYAVHGTSPLCNLYALWNSSRGVSHLNGQSRWTRLRLLSRGLVCV
jgi:hypothetical protein